MRKILWLASWYPNDSDPYAGDFIKRQAEAVGIFQPLKLIYAGKQKTGVLKRVPIPTDSNTSVEENILYYSGSGRGIFSKSRSLVSYFKKHLDLIRRLREKNELPDLVHVQVAMKAGLVALYLKWKYKIPYILTEHWTGYYEQSADSLFRKSFLDKYLTRRILKNASLFLPVSEALGNQISHYWAMIPFKKIPNVVDTRLFYPATGSQEVFRFIHISTLSGQKNPEGIVLAFSAFLETGHQAELVLIGPPSGELMNLINRQEHTGKILCRGEISYEEVSRELRKSSALILFSNYENMPCVILEALCTGIPVIATRVGGIDEVIGEENGMLVHAGNQWELLEAMKNVFRNYSKYNKTRISSLASQQFSYETIGQEITAVYDSLLNTPD